MKPCPTFLSRWCPKLLRPVTLILSPTKWIVPILLLNMWGGAQTTLPNLKLVQRRVLIKYQVEHAVAYEKVVIALSKAQVSFEPLRYQFCVGGGLATKEQVEKVMASVISLEKWCGKNSLAGGIWVIPPPTFPTPQTSQLGALVAKVKPIPPAKARASIHWAVEINNPTYELHSLTWGDDSLDFVLLDSAGNPVRWLTKIYIFAYGAGANCPAKSACVNDMALLQQESSIPLRSFVTGHPLAPGQYFLRVNVKNVKLDGQKLNITLPDQPFEVMP